MLVAIVYVSVCVCIQVQTSQKKTKTVYCEHLHGLAVVFVMLLIIIQCMSLSVLILILFCMAKVYSLFPSAISLLVNLCVWFGLQILLLYLYKMHAVFVSFALSGEQQQEYMFSL